SRTSRSPAPCWAGNPRSTFARGSSGPRSGSPPSWRSKTPEVLTPGSPPRGRSGGPVGSLPMSDNGEELDLTSSKVVVTGGSGFLGRAVLARLEAAGAADVVAPTSAEVDL